MGERKEGRHSPSLADFSLGRKNVHCSDRGYSIGFVIPGEYCGSTGLPYNTFKRGERFRITTAHGGEGGNSTQSGWRGEIRPDGGDLFHGALPLMPRRLSNNISVSPE